MSSEVGDRADVAGLRAMAHPLRLRILSLLTGTAMSAAEVARELDLTHANASYHLRLLSAAGLLADAGVESIRGGRAKRYRYDVDAPAQSSGDREDAALFYRAIATELERRAARRVGGKGTKSTSGDAELWVSSGEWAKAVDDVTSAVRDLHRAAVPAGSPGARHVSITTALFEMDPGR